MCLFVVVIQPNCPCLPSLSGGTRIPAFYHTPASLVFKLHHVTGNLSGGTGRDGKEPAVPYSSYSPPPVLPWQTWRPYIQMYGERTRLARPFLSPHWNLGASDMWFLLFRLTLALTNILSCHQNRYSFSPLSHSSLGLPSPSPLWNTAIYTGLLSKTSVTLQWQSCVGSPESLWPPKPKIFTVCSWKEACKPLTLHNTLHIISAQ